MAPVGDYGPTEEQSPWWRLAGLVPAALGASAIAVAVGLPVGLVLLVTDVYANLWLVLLAVFVLALPIAWWRER